MTIGIENRQRLVTLDRRKIRRHLRALLERLAMKDAEVSLVFTDDEGIRALNRDYLGRDWPTNVISFAQGEGQWGHLNPQLLGDIVVNVERVQKDASVGELPFTDVLDFFLIHGLLHLLGYEHEGERTDEAERMERKENELFFSLKGYGLDRA
jgi:probable rRNA maturation factor